jgi:hypothetical protein
VRHLAPAILWTLREKAYILSSKNKRSFTLSNKKCGIFGVGNHPSLFHQPFTIAKPTLNKDRRRFGVHPLEIRAALLFYVPSYFILFR